MTKKILIAALLACAFAPAQADEMEEPQERVERMERRIVTRQGDTLQVHTGDLGGLRAFEGSFTGPLIQMHPGRVVKNAPYSAESVSERVRQLADGNQIVNKASSMNYRDSAGRTRSEVRDDNGQVRVVTIHDPVEGVRWVLRPNSKTATRVAAPGEAARVAATEHARAAREYARVAAEQARAHVEQLRREGKLSEDSRIIVKEVARADEHKDVRIRIAEPAAAAALATRDMSIQLGPMIAGAIGDAKWAAKAVSRDLGTREFSGVKAQGRQRSYEIPAGEIGNRDPITVSSETWTSPELQVMVYHKHSDPRSGDMVYRLDDLKRGEPAAALFTVPSDYTVRDAMAPGRTTVIKKGE
ncbi:hypothetical protein [Massilia niastensis]|uniref:hypothetical protein n=1 Tax=Massilia niastensis TaxID=544911 RepID=UPI000379DA83|nr:hypothetical protein [Massilia niastensis]